jgi:hypothetical protein
MNSSLSSTTGYTPVEVMGESNKLKLFDNFRLPSTIPSKQKEDLPTKMLKVCSRLKLKSEKKRKEKKERKFKCKFNRRFGISEMSSCFRGRSRHYW